MYVLPKERFLLLKKYYIEFGNLLPPRNFVFEGINISSYIQELRKKYKKGHIEHSEIDKLEAIGMVWDVIDFKWNLQYKESINYYKQYGNLEIPLRYVTENNISLGTWIQLQRENYERLYSANPNPNFTNEHKKKLDDIGMNWNPYESQWEEKFLLAKEYFLRNGNLLISNDYITESNIKLGIWLSNQRKDYKNLETPLKNPKFTQERINKLGSIGMIWDVYEHLSEVRIEKEVQIRQLQQENRKNKRDTIWNKYYKEAVKYYEQNGNLLVPHKYVDNGISLGQWIGKQRIKYEKNLLNDYEIKSLEKIQMVWDVFDFYWEQYFMLAEKYYEEHGDLLIKVDYQTVDGEKLGFWINNQRQSYKNQNLSNDKVTKLESIKMIWNPNEEQWEQKYKIAKKYFMNYGNLSVQANYEENNVKLGNWISIQRQNYKLGLLDETKVIRLEKIGMIWDPLEEKWQYYYQLANEYYGKFGNLLIPISYEKKGFRLGQWIFLQRKWYKKINTDDSNKNFTVERIKLLEKIGMVWEIPQNYNKTSFEEQCVFYYIKALFPNAKNNCRELGFELDILISELNIGIEYDGEYWHTKEEKIFKDHDKNKKCLDNGIRLIRIREPKCLELKDGLSINYMLKNNSNIELQNIIVKLIEEQFHIKFNVDIIRDMDNILKQYFFRINESWNTMYEFAKQYYNKHGDLLIPDTYEIEGFGLGRWVGTQRRAFKGKGKSIISPEQIDKLDQIGMTWDVKQANWQMKYLLAKQYYNQYGNLLIPSSYVINNIKLGRWIGTQRQAYKGNHFKISDKQIEKLNDIGMVWEVY
jgi:hypothetical protein